MHKIHSLPNFVFSFLELERGGEGEAGWGFWLPSNLSSAPIYIGYLPSHLFVYLSYFPAYLIYHLTLT
jgi:hypothetical protein